MGVWKKRGKGRRKVSWYYEFQNQGKREAGYGYPTREAAMEAEVEARRRLKSSQTHIIFFASRE